MDGGGAVLQVVPTGNRTPEEEEGDVHDQAYVDGTLQSHVGV